MVSGRQRIGDEGLLAVHARPREAVVSEQRERIEQILPVSLVEAVAGVPGEPDRLAVGEHADVLGGKHGGRVVVLPPEPEGAAGQRSRQDPALPRRDGEGPDVADEGILGDFVVVERRAVEAGDAALRAEPDIVERRARDGPDALVGHAVVDPVAGPFPGALVEPAHAAADLMGGPDRAVVALADIPDAVGRQAVLPGEVPEHAVREVADAAQAPVGAEPDRAAGAHVDGIDHVAGQARVPVEMGQALAVAGPRAGAMPFGGDEPEPPLAVGDDAVQRHALVGRRQAEVAPAAAVQDPRPGKGLGAARPDGAGSVLGEGGDPAQRVGGRHGEGFRAGARDARQPLLGANPRRAVPGDKQAEHAFVVGSERVGGEGLPAIAARVEARDSHGAQAQPQSAAVIDDARRRNGRTGPDAREPRPAPVEIAAVQAALRRRGVDDAVRVSGEGEHRGGRRARGGGLPAAVAALQKRPPSVRAPEARPELEPARHEEPAACGAVQAEGGQLRVGTPRVALLAQEPLVGAYPDDLVAVDRHAGDPVGGHRLDGLEPVDAGAFEPVQGPRRHEVDLTLFAGGQAEPLGAQHALEARAEPGGPDSARRGGEDRAVAAFGDDADRILGPGLAGEGKLVPAVTVVTEDAAAAGGVVQAVASLEDRGKVALRQAVLGREDAPAPFLQEPLVGGGVPAQTEDRKGG